MKNFIKLFVIVLALAFVFISCEKGGTIEVLNQAGDPVTHKNLIIIVKGADFAGALNDLEKGKGTEMAIGQSKTFSFSEDGLYTVVASFPITKTPPFVFTKTATLLLGSSERVTIK
jgi:hypothetical protein